MQLTIGMLQFGRETIEKELLLFWRDSQPTVNEISIVVFNNKTRVTC